MMAISESKLANAAQALKPAIMAFAAAAILVVAVLAFRLQGELNSYQQDAVDNIHWNISQLELDIVRFAAEAEIVQLKPDEPLSELRKRFDLFYSRCQSALKGTMFGKLGMTDVATPMNRRLETYLEETTPLIDSPDYALREDLPQIEADANALREDLRKMSVAIVERYATLADQRRATFAGLVRQAAWAGALVIAALVLLLTLVLWLNRQAVRMAVETTRVSSRLAATVGTSLDAIIVADSAGRVLDFNNAASMTFGYSRSEAVGADLGALIVPPHMRAAHDNGMARMNRYGSFRVVNSGRFQMSAVRKGGAEFPVEMSIASHNTTDGMIFIAFLRDISDRVTAEKALLDARDAAMAAEKSKTNFMAVMSHEMRTPLNGVMAALEIARGMTSNAKQARFLELAQSSARQLLRHANDVLDISKVEAGKLHIAREDFDLIALAEDLVAGLQQVAAQKGTEVTVETLSPMPMLNGDYFRISQIIQNFLTNAMKFTDNGQITVEIEVQERKGTTLIVEVRVIDTGIGIAERDQERIFEDFVMVDPSYGRTGGGTGLGLAISRRLAKAMGGEIGVESELGSGSCFWVRLPLTLASEQSPRETERAKVDTSLPSLDVLVVEDNATNRIVLEEMLLQMGHRVTLAEDGGQGMEVARAHRFDVILMDISMPLMDGLTATSLIRMEGKSMTSRILAVTAHSMPDDMERFRQAGMDGCLTKPISIKDLSLALSGEKTDAAQAFDLSQDLNLERLEDLREGLGKDGLARMIARFRADFGGLLTRLDDACAPESLAHLMPVCHEGAGVCAMVGASMLHQHFAKAEDLCRSGKADEAAVLVKAETRALWHKADAALAAMGLSA